MQLPMFAWSSPWLPRLLLTTVALASRFGSDVPHVFTFSNRFSEDLCHLASTTEAAGGRLRVVGLADAHRFSLPWESEIAPYVKEGQHFVFINRLFFLLREVERLPEEDIVVYVDGWDVLFQRPLTYISSTYRRMVRTTLERRGDWPKRPADWPVVFGGSKTCDPFPQGRSKQNWFSTFEEPANDFPQEYTDKRFRCEDGSEVIGGEVCDAAMSRHFRRLMYTVPSAKTRYGFGQVATYVGTAGAVRRVLQKMLDIHRSSFELDDMALLNVLLLCNETDGLIDTGVELFYSLGGHHDVQDLQRPLCEEGYFHPGDHDASFFKAGRPPQVFGSMGSLHASIPAVLHFDGKTAKVAYRDRCVKYFQRQGVINTDRSDELNCTFIHSDRGSVVVVQNMRSRGVKRRFRDSAPRALILQLDSQVALGYDRTRAVLSAWNEKDVAHSGRPKQLYSKFLAESMHRSVDRI